MLDGGVAVGEHALAGALRFFAVGRWVRLMAGEDGVLRRCFGAALQTRLLSSGF